MQTYPNANSLQAYQYFLRFKDGNEAGLSHIYKHFYKLQLKHGRNTVSDLFVVDTAIQEAFLGVWQFRQRLTSPLHAYQAHYGSRQDKRSLKN